MNVFRCRRSETMECSSTRRVHFKNRPTQTALMEAETRLCPPDLSPLGGLHEHFLGHLRKRLVLISVTLSHKYLFQQERSACICFMLFMKILCELPITVALNIHIHSFSSQHFVLKLDTQLPCLYLFTCSSLIAVGQYEKEHEDSIQGQFHYCPGGLSDPVNSICRLR